MAALVFSSCEGPTQTRPGSVVVNPVYRPGPGGRPMIPVRALTQVDQYGRPFGQYWVEDRYNGSMVNVPGWQIDAWTWNGALIQPTR